MTYSVHISHVQAIVSGIVSLKEQHFSEAITPANKVLFQTEYCIILAQGEISGIKSHPTHDAFALLVGRIYTRGFSMKALASETIDDAASIPVILKDLEGSFNFIQYSSKDENVRFFIATDRFGSRRMLYTVRNEKLYFSTHLSGLSRLLPEGSFCVSQRALLHYYNFGFTPNDETLIAGINKVAPGSCLEFSHNGMSVNSYTGLGELFRPEEYASRSIEDVSLMLDDITCRAVQAHCDHNETVGCLLSGGVDSGYLACILRDIGAEVHAYNIAYGNAYNEYDRVDCLASHLGISVRKIKLLPNQIIENFLYSNSICSEPVGFNNATIRLATAEASMDGVACLFDGDGVDRLFLGMTRFTTLRRAIQIHKQLNCLGMARIFGLIAQWLPWPDTQKLSRHFLNWNASIPPYIERKLNLSEPYNLDYERKIFQMAIRPIWDEFCREFPDSIRCSELFLTFQGIKMCPEMFFCDPNELESNLGIFRAAGYWTKALVSLALSIPTEWKLRRTTTKYILRLAAGHRFDPTYWMLPKIGLQDSYRFSIQSKEGEAWRDQMRKEICDSYEYSVLSSIIPAGQVELDRLVGIIVWRKQNASARRLIRT